MECIQFLNLKNFFSLRNEIVRNVEVYTRYFFKFNRWNKNFSSLWRHCLSFYSSLSGNSSSSLIYFPFCGKWNWEVQWDRNSRGLAFYLFLVKNLIFFFWLLFEGRCLEWWFPFFWPCLACLTFRKVFTDGVTVFLMITTHLVLNFCLLLSHGHEEPTMCSCCST